MEFPLDSGFHNQFLASNLSPHACMSLSSNLIESRPLPSLSNPGIVQGVIGTHQKRFAICIHYGIFVSSLLYISKLMYTMYALMPLVNTHLPRVMEFPLDSGFHNQFLASNPSLHAYMSLSSNLIESLSSSSLSNPGIVQGVIGTHQKTISNLHSLPSFFGPLCIRYF
ncbi:hypothetical protein CEXT_360531 [Caerostris extrusa]|uniref:Cytochrome c biogenesis B n=1 Tax=Caerostris extrusa TaxID=172846 RepID=A0AAV4R8A5_CAEEX|nr:hypothetical protein CEXT_360531 [Caerostris extrusa]